MKSLILCLVLLCGAALLPAQAPQWQWATVASGTDEEALYAGSSIAIDNQGNQYICGTFDGLITFGSHILTSLGGDIYGDIFVAKLDPAGNWLWAVRAGGFFDDMASGIALDGSGNIYVTGQFGGIANFGTHTLTANVYDDDYCDIFVAKLDADGNWLWAIKAGGSHDDYGNSIAIDAAGNGYVIGDYEGTATFGNHALTATGGEWYEKDIFVAKFNPSGEWLWAVSGGGTWDDWGQSIALDGSGNIYVTGTFEITATFGDYTLTATGEDITSRDVFVAKMNQNGDWLWATKAGGILWENGSSIALDAAGNAYVTGDFCGTAYFGNHTLTASGDNDDDDYCDIFVAKLDQNGNWLWAAQAGGALDDTGIDIALDAAGNVYVTGAFESSATFGDHNLTASLGKIGIDLFLAKLDPNGDWLWAVKAGGPLIDIAFGLTPDGAGNTYVTGLCGPVASFGNHTVTANGFFNIFVAKLGNETPVDDDLAPQVASRLHDAWPNPFTKGRSTTIKADIPERSTGTLSIYNLRGQKVASYKLSSGLHEINFSGENLPAGVYLYSLKCEDYQETKRLVLLK
ncbi:MAG TPA: T9SS type A sorting domain-containing protein [Candidatus Cloacimonetes bacterium]|nr:T9SS type A sorting domain-containing protein [Candidatus Cloacimonadota bacterium]